MKNATFTEVYLEFAKRVETLNSMRTKSLRGFELHLKGGRIVYLKAQYPKQAVRIFSESFKGKVEKIVSITDKGTYTYKVHKNKYVLR